MYVANSSFVNKVKSSLNSTSFMFIKVFFGTLESIPPPTKYLTVIVVFDGDVPYDFVFKKFVGSNDSSNLPIEFGNPKPTFLRFGISCSSYALGSPAPN